MGLMTTDASTQLPFFSRVQTNDTARVDLLNHNVKNIPGPLQKCSVTVFHNRP